MINMFKRIYRYFFGNKMVFTTNLKEISSKDFYKKIRQYVYDLENLKYNFKNTNIPVIITTPELEQPGPIIIYANESFKKITHYTDNDILGNSPRILQGELTNKKIFSTEFKNNLLNGKVVYAETVNYTKDRKPYRLFIIIFPYYNNGEIVNFIGFHDVREFI